MRIFTKTYHQSNASLRLTDFTIDPTLGMYSIGYTKKGGYLSKLDLEAKPVYTFEYTLKGARLYFSKLLVLPNGELSVLGYSKGANQRLTLYILKINELGILVSSIKLKVSNIRFISEFLLLPDERILITGWYTPPRSSADKMYVCTIDQQLSPSSISGMVYSIGNDDQLGCAAVFQESIYLFGAQHSPSLRGFYVQLNLTGGLAKVGYIECDSFKINAINDVSITDAGELKLFASCTTDNKTSEPAIIRGIITPNGLEITEAFKIDWSDSPLYGSAMELLRNELVLINFDGSGNYFFSLLDANLQMVWRKSIEFDNASFINLQSTDDELYVYGNTSKTKLTSPLLIKTDGTFENCKAKDEEIKAIDVFEVFTTETELELLPFRPMLEEAIINSREFTLNVANNCEQPLPVFELLTPHKVQSSAINLQAAGCVGTDASKGIHLRWFLNSYLGDNHIPKGNYANNNRFFNRKDDFFKIYRIPYDNGTQQKLRFNLFDELPFQIRNNERLWVYKINENVLFLNFLDENKYSQSLANFNPIYNQKDFMNSYGSSLLEISQPENLSFAINIITDPNSHIKTEAFSVANKSTVEDTPVLSSRKSFSGSGTSYRVVAENIRTLKISIILGSLLYIELENYTDFLRSAVQNNDISYINAYALSKDENEVFNRLEDSSKFLVDNHWLKFNDQAHVNVDNYKERWEASNPNPANVFGLKIGVEDYINLSETDPSATKTFSDGLNGNDLSTMEIALQKFIVLASLDYHVARMLGLGTIDHDSITNGNKSFIYLAAYNTDKNVENFKQPEFLQHLYLSLPTSIETERLPQDIEFSPVTYGLPIDNATSQPLLITNPQGYAPYINARYVNLKSRLKKDYSESISFYNPSIEFESSVYSTPVFFGIENKKNNESNWRRPEIAHDTDYKDHNNIYETQTVLFDPESEQANYVHEVTEEGIDHYAGYSINIFSRASGLSNVVDTDYTKFKKANTLNPPVNIRVQLIQSENPLLITTEKEQKWLAAIDPVKKKILCRLDFEYNYAQDKNYGFGTKIGMFYRSEMPKNIMGSIDSITEDLGDISICTLHTNNYYYISTGETVVPKIDANILDNFKGSNLTYRTKTYKVIEVIPTNVNGTNPDIRIKKIEKRDAIHTSGVQNQLQQIYNTIEADPDEAFLLVENLSKSNSWKDDANQSVNKFAFEIELDNAAWLERTETYKDKENNTISETAKGIWDEAEIKLLTTTGTSPVDYYEITFDNFVLGAHPQKADILNVANKFSVDWHHGYVRAHIQQDISKEQKRKELQVIEISEDSLTGKLILKATDPAMDSVDPSKNIKEGSNILINYHPGYRVYFKEESAIGFDENGLLPEEDEGTRYGLIGLNTIDMNTLDAQSNEYKSYMSVPVILFARELITPLKPKKPIGPLFANPPDFDNKANYSFTTLFESQNHKPWGIVYYRISANKILSLLYEPKTIAIIKENLPKVAVDDLLEERWEDLLSFDYVGNLGDFGSFKIDQDGNKYKFPWPDREDFLENLFNKGYIPTNKPVLPSDISEYIKDVIHSNMLPLTKQPLICKYIKNGTYVPQPTEQKIMDAMGKMLHPSDPEFDQAPMAKKVSDTEITFTDFTLDSDMNSETIYFYVVREMSNSMQFGEPSAFLGPVQLINTKPPDKLIVKKMITPLANFYNDFSSEIHFFINQFSETQDLSKIEILRTLESKTTLNVRNMVVVKSIDVADLEFTDGIYKVVDDFENDLEVPYAVPLYFRLRGVRTINYKDHLGSDKTRSVYSEPTKVFLTNVVDMLPPESPELKVDNIIETATEISSLKLKWNKTCFNGKYSLLYLNEFNTWEKKIEIQSNDEPELIYETTNPISKVNDEGDIIYPKFKVAVENTSGLMSRSNKIIVLT